MALPLMVKVSRSSIGSADEDLVRTIYYLGKSKSEIFFRVIPPLSKGGIMSRGLRGAIRRSCRGQRQRVALPHALMRKPKMLLFVT